MPGWCINLPSIHSVLDQYSDAGSSTGYDNEIGCAEKVINIKHEGDMDLDMDVPMPNLVEVTNAVADSESSPMELGVSAISNEPLGNIPVNGLPRLALSSFNSHLISIPNPKKPVALGYYCDMYQGLYAPTRLKLALKCPRLLEGTTQAEDVKRRYKREAKTWLSLNHINVLPFYGVIELSSIAYLVAPWVALGDLSKFLAARLEYLEHDSPTQGSVSHQRAAFSAFDETATIHGIASGLAYLHACGVIHGDIKAANILLADSLTPLLGDFGLTKSPEFNATSPGLKGTGTSRWKSPGLTDDQPRTTKTDIYALGMTIVEILTGREPFPHLHSNFKVCNAVIQGQRPSFEPPSRNGKDFIPLWELAASCWEVEAKNRPTAAKVVGRTVAHLSTDSLRCIPIKTDSNVPSDGGPVKDLASGSRASGEHNSLTACLSNETPSEELEANDSGLDSSFGDASELLNIATLHRTEGRDGFALSVLQAASQQFRGLSDRKGMAVCLRGIGEILHRLGHDDEATSPLNEAFWLYEELGDRFFMAECAQITGDVLNALGRFDDAISKYTEGYKLLQQLDEQSRTLHGQQTIPLPPNRFSSPAGRGHEASRSKTIKSRNSIGEQNSRVSYSLGQIGGRNFHNGNKNAEYNSDNRMAMARCLVSIADTKTRQELHDPACTLYSEAANIYRELGDRRMTARCLGFIGDSAGSRAHYHDALTALSETVTIYKDLGDRSMIADTLIAIGCIREDQGQHHDACTSYSDAATIFEELNNRIMMAECLLYIGRSMSDQERCDDAHTSLQKAYAIYLELGNRIGVAVCLYHIGVTKSSQGHNEEACTSWGEAAAIYREVGNRRMTARCLGFIGNNKESQGHYHGALTALSEAVTIYRDLGDQSTLADTLIAIGRTREDQRYYDEACTSYSDAATIFEELGNRTMMAECLFYIGKTRKDQEHYGDAFDALSKVWAIVKESNDRRAISTCVKAVEVVLDVWRRSENLISKSSGPLEPLGVLNETRKLVDSLCRTGKVRCHWEHYEAAMRSFNDAQRLLKGPEDG
ncbi:hypothetical protein FRB94_003462 [Tulasnella sp. JGI-2019a]|nr:hypothetical protein FRB94_003462 [Tulasnella sp. JGI-2019a]